MREVAVDPSAIVAIALDEADAEEMLTSVAGIEPVMSQASRIELAQVMLRKVGPDGLAEVEGILQDYGFRFEPFDEAQAKAALDGLMRFGRGRRSEPAVLNLGDSFSYALAKSQGIPLLFKGDDFSRTDVTPFRSGEPDEV